MLHKIQIIVSDLEISRHGRSCVQKHSSSVDVYKKLVLFFVSLGSKLYQSNKAQLLAHLEEGENEFSTATKQIDPHLQRQVYKQAVLLDGI